MPDRLTLRTTMLLVGLAFTLTLVVQGLLGGGSPAAKPAAKRTASGPVAEAPGAAPDLRLVATGTVPSLREPRQPRKRKVRRQPKPSVRKVVRAAPRIAPARVVPTATAQPTPTAAPRYIPPAPRRVAPAPRPKPPAPKPAPTAAPPSGEFDTSGGP